MRVLLALLVAAQNPVVPAPPPPPSPTPDTAHLVIVATTDVHGRVLGWDYVHDVAAPGGLARAATILETLRAQYPDQVVLVDAGDLIEGNLFAAYFARRDQERPHPLVDALNAMQYDAATPGNHDFDFGPSVLARALQDATYRYVSANVYRGGTDTLLYAPYSVIERAGGKVGMPGFTTAGVMVWDRGPGAYRVTSVRADLLPLTSTPELPRFTRRFAAAHERVRTWAATPLGSAGPGFSGRFARAEDTPLLDFINEVQRRRAGADLSAAADFDLDAGLPEGEVRMRDVAGIYPYENTLRAVRISGRQLREYLEHAGRYFRTYQPGAPIVDDSVPASNYDVVSGANYDLDLSQPPGQRIRGLAFRGRPVQPTDSFTLALASYRQEGGGGYTMLQGAPVVYDRGESIRALLAQEIGKVGTITAPPYYTPSWSILPPAREAVHLAFAPAAPPVSQRDSTVLRVLAINDFHGALEARIWPWSDGRPVGGAAALKPWLDSLARACGCTTVRLDGGDEMQGTLLSNFSFGLPAIATLNAFGT